MHVGSTLDHVMFFFDAATGNLSAVSHSNEQSAAVTVGEGGQSLGDFVGVVDAQFEVLMLMLPFLNHAQDIRHEVKVGRKGQIAYFCSGKT